MSKTQENEFETCLLKDDNENGLSDIVLLYQNKYQLWTLIKKFINNIMTDLYKINVKLSEGQQRNQQKLTEIMKKSVLLRYKHICNGGYVIKPDTKSRLEVLRHPLL